MSYYTLRDAAALLGISPDTLRLQMRNGRIRAERLGREHRGHLVFAEAELARYDWESRGRTGRRGPRQADKIAAMDRAVRDDALARWRRVEWFWLALSPFYDGSAVEGYLATAQIAEVRRLHRVLERWLDTIDRLDDGARELWRLLRPGASGPSPRPRRPAQARAMAPLPASSAVEGYIATASRFDVRLLRRALTQMQAAQGEQFACRQAVGHLLRGESPSPPPEGEGA